MNDLIKVFPLQLLFRGIFPGFFFALSFIIAKHDISGFSNLGKEPLALWIPLAIFVGVTAYVIHRSLIYPLIEWIFNSECFGEFSDSVPLISDNTINRSMQMWSTGESEKPYQNIARHLTVWNDYIQLQYVAVECIVLGAILGGTDNSNIDRILLYAGIYLSMGGFISEWRFRQVCKVVSVKYAVENWYLPPDTIRHSASDEIER